MIKNNQGKKEEKIFLFPKSENIHHKFKFSFFIIIIIKFVELNLYN